MLINKINNLHNTKIEIPSSKSYTNRALIISALNNNEVVLHNPLYSDDTKYMMESLEKLGIKFKKQDKDLIVFGNGGHFDVEENMKLFCGIAGTTSRFLTAFLALIDRNIVITGEGKLLERPIAELVDSLRQIGADIEYLGLNGSLPIKGNCKNISNSEISISGNISSQYLSALLMVAPILKNGLTVNVIGEQVSKSYIDMTIDIMKTFNVDVINNDYKKYIIKPSIYNAKEYNVEGDWSSAAYFICMGALIDGGIEIINLNINSVQGDKDFIKLMEQIGAIVEYKNNSIVVSKNKIKPLNVNMEQMPDSALALAVLLSFADGNSKITGLSTLKHKESNRLLALHNELKKISVESEIGDDFIIIHGHNNHKILGNIETYSDHRIAMAFAIAGVKLGNLNILNPEVVNKSFPEFWQYLNKFKE